MLRDRILTLTGRDDRKVRGRIEQALERVYDGLLVGRAIWGDRLEIPPQILEECKRRCLVLVTFFREGEKPADESVIAFSEQISLNEMKARLEEYGLRLSRLARVISDDEKQSLALILGRLDKEEQRRGTSSAFVAVTRARDGDDRLPVLEEDEITWISELRGTGAEYLLLPVPCEAESGTETRGHEAVSTLLHGLLLERRINIGPRARLLESEGLLVAFKGLRARSGKNLAHGLALIKELSPDLTPNCDTIFDDKSGAVFFDPHDWRTLEMSQSSSRTCKTLLRFFREKSPEAWSPAHPCYQRILWTPTKVLLRGEAYYINMRRLSPVKRFVLMLEEMKAIGSLIDRLYPDLTPMKQVSGEWKLMLALLDQMRNCSLQTFSFLHEAARIMANRGAIVAQVQELYGNRQGSAHGFLSASVRAYYDWLLLRTTQAADAANVATRCFRGMESQLLEAARALQAKIDEDGLTQSDLLKDLVRGWREADHPGENLITALVASEKLKDRSDLVAVGIGWGGIELPLIYDHVANIRTPQQARRTFIAKYSHYRAEEIPPKWTAFPDAPESSSDSAQVAGCEIALFDDNTLTGITLERVRDALLLQGSSKVHMFITRYSGERRLHHMQMKNHGIVDPEYLEQEIGGYVGETPFARSWSKKDYNNQIGVFSLARRRILECIYNNSTVELYNREGF